MSAIPEAALEQPVAIVGKVGSGKTYAAKSAVEGLLRAGRRVVIIDPTGVWHGLRTMADGSPGFPIVLFGGEHADIPIASAAGEQLGALLGSDQVGQAIVDVSDFSTGERVRFLTALFEEIYRGTRVPRHLVMDEADEMAPQNPMPETARLLGIVDKIVRRGRVRGFRPLMITQRPAVLHKNVLSQIGTLVALQLTSPQDRKAIETWVKGNADEGEAREVLASLAKLPRGEGWVWSPAAHVLERTRFPPIATLDTSSTPDHEEEVTGPRIMAAVDVDAIRAALTSSTSNERAKTDMRSDRLSAEALTAAEGRGYQLGFAEGRQQAVSLVESAVTALVGTIDRLKAGDGILSLRDQTFAGATGEPSGSPLSDVQPRWQTDPEAGAVKVVKLPRATPVPRESGAGTLNSAARKMLAVLDTNPPVRRSWTQVATLAGLRARGGHFNAGRKALLDGGLVVAEGELVRIAAPSGAVGPSQTDPGALVETWAAALAGAAPRILRHLFEVGGGSSRERVAAALGLAPRGGHWNAAWKELRDNDIVEEAGGLVELTELFRPRRA